MGREGGLFFRGAFSGSDVEDGDSEEMGEGSGVEGRGISRARRLPHTRNDVPAYGTIPSSVTAKPR